MEKKSSKKEIQKVVLVLLSAIFFAILLAFYMIQYYGPTGRYIAGNMILSSETLNKINYQDRHPQTGAPVHFIFNNIIVSYFDPFTKKQTKNDVSIESYQKLFQLIKDEKNIQEIDKNMILEFKQYPVSLTLNMKTDSSAASVEKKFQLLQFTNNDYFRIQLHGDNAEDWLYFKQDGIYQKMLKLFAQK